MSPKPETSYECKACKSPATVKGDTVIRSCQCNAPVVANLYAVARGAGAVK